MFGLRFLSSGAAAATSASVSVSAERPVHLFFENSRARAQAESRDWHFPGISLTVEAREKKKAVGDFRRRRFRRDVTAFRGAVDRSKAF